MKLFSDLHLRPSIGDHNLETLISKSYELGYRLIGISLPLNITQHKILRFKKICNNIGLDFVSRLDLIPKTTSELLKSLQRFRRKFELISIICSSKPVARQAAKDRRVDLISFNISPHQRFFDQAEAELASRVFSALEIDMSKLLILKGFSRSRFLYCLRKEMEIAKKFHVPIVFSSGATNNSLLRTPYDYAALGILFDFKIQEGLLAFSDTPLNIVKRNREKLSLDYIAPGIRIVKGGKSCHIE